MSWCVFVCVRGGGGVNWHSGRCGVEQLMGPWWQQPMCLIMRAATKVPVLHRTITRYGHDRLQGRWCVNVFDALVAVLKRGVLCPFYSGGGGIQSCCCSRR